LELTGWDGSRVVAAQRPKDIFYALPEGIPHPIAQVLGDTLVVDPVRLTAVRSLLERTSSDGDDSEGDDNDDDDDDDGSPAASERIGGGRHHAPLVTREAASSLRFGAPTQNGYRWLGLLAMGALGHADGRPTYVASLPVLPWPDRPVATGTLPGLGTYRWNRDLGILKLTTTDGQDVVADHGPNDLFYVFYDGDYHPIGQILEGRALVIDPELLDDAESALGEAAQASAPNLVNRIIAAVINAINPIGSAEAQVRGGGGRRGAGGNSDLSPAEDVRLYSYKWAEDSFMRLGFGGSGGAQVTNSDSRAFVPSEAQVRAAQERLRDQEIRKSYQISRGHGFKSHRGEFKNWNGNKPFTQDNYQNIILEVLRSDKTRIKECPGGRTMYYLKEGSRKDMNVIVYIDPNNPDGGTAFRPTKGEKMFDDEEGTEIFRWK
jgi:hypothetical protein